MAINVGVLNEDQDYLVKVGNADEYDYISELPEDVISFILSFLTARDAVKARVLSSRWRYLIVFTPDLNFDLFTLFGINDNREYWLKHSAHLWEDKFRFIRAVDQYLQLCRSQIVYSFRVCYCLGHESAWHIDRWVNFAVEMKIEKLELNFSFIPRGCERYNFPCHLLPNDEGSRLKHLCLQSCMLRPSPDFTNRLNSLKILDLNDVDLDQRAFDVVGSGCVNLERLKLKNCILPWTFLISGQFHCLKWLALEYCDGANEIEVSYINLTTFEYIGIIVRLSIVGIRSLEKVHIDFIHPFFTGSNYMFDRLAKDAPRLQTLSLVLSTNEMLRIPANMPAFSHLKELVLECDLSTAFDLLSVAFFLDACPCLQKLHLALNHSSFNGKRVKRVYPLNLHYQLKEVEISGFRDECNSVDLAIHLLNCAVELERMIINSERKYYLGDGRWNSVRCLMMDASEKKYVQRVLSLAKDKVKPHVQLIVL